MNCHLYKKYIIIFYILYLALLILGLFHYDEVFHSTPTVSGSPLTGDQNFYDRTGFSISKGEGYSLDGNPTCFYQIGYPLFLGLIYSVFGHNYKVVIIIQIILLFSTFVLFSIISTKINKSLFFVPLILFIINYIIHPYAYKLLTEVLALSLLMLCVFLLYNFFQSNKNYLLIFIGLIYGYLTLVRPIFQIYPFLLLVFSILLIVKGNYKTFLRYLIFFLSFFVVISPMMYRNYKKFKLLKLGSAGGYMFYQGTNPDYDGVYQGWKRVESDLNLQKYYGNRSTNIGSISADKIAEIDDILFSEGLKNIKKYPFKVASIVCKNASRLLFFFPYKGHKLSIQRSILSFVNIISFISMLIGLYFVISNKMNFRREVKIFLYFCYSILFYYIIISSFFATSPRYGIYPLVIIYLLVPFLLNFKLLKNKE